MGTVWQGTGEWGQVDRDRWVGLVGGQCGQGQVGGDNVGGLLFVLEMLGPALAPWMTCESLSSAAFRDSDIRLQGRSGFCPLGRHIGQDSAVCVSFSNSPSRRSHPQAQAGRGSKSFQPALPMHQCHGRGEPRVAPVLERYVLRRDLQVRSAALLSRHGHRIPPGDAPWLRGAAAGNQGAG